MEHFETNLTYMYSRHFEDLKLISKFLFFFVGVLAILQFGKLGLEVWY